MSGWACGIVGCDARFEEPSALVEHQVLDHDATVCGVCGKPVPAGFLAIRHAFDEHTRADYLRAYDADSDDIRVRENVKEAIEETVDVRALLDGLDVNDTAVSVGN